MTCACLDLGKPAENNKPMLGRKMIFDSARLDGGPRAKYYSPKVSRTCKRPPALARNRKAL